MADIMLSEDGDIVLDDVGDIMLAEGAEYVIQSVRNRLKSVTVDWFYDHIGADLIDFLGYPNSRETADAITERIVSALTRDGLISKDDLFVKVVPIDSVTLNIFVFVKTADMWEPVGFKVDLNLNSGAAVTQIQRR